MSHRVHKRARRVARTALVTATSLPAIFLCAAAGAQESQASSTSQPPAGASELQEVVVTGFRASLQSALDAKRQSLQPIESIVPEDIGKMPDQNVSESLQRLPGISINRSGGKGTQVLIDGLGNNLITLNGEVLLTGREIYSSGEGSGGAGGIQYASLEGIPSEEIGGIDVIKNPTAMDREGGLGGQINLKTRSPLAQDMGLNFGGNARGTKASGAEGGVTPVATLVGGFKFSDDFAITAGASYDDQKTHTKEFQDQNRNQWLITNTATIGSYAGSPVASTNTVLPGGQTYIDPQLAYFSDILNQIKTKGATLGAEWRWNEDISSDFNYFYIHEDETSTTYSDKGWFSGGSGENNSAAHGYQIDPVTGVVTPPAAAAPASFPGIDPSQPYSIDGNGVIQSATMMANGAETATLYESNKTTAHNFQLNTRFGGNNWVTGDLGLAYAKATGDYEAAQADVEHGFYGAFGSASPSVQPTAPGCNNGSNNCTNGNHGYAWVYSNGGTSGLPTASYPDNYGYTNLLSNPAYTLFKSNWAWANKVDEKQYAVKFNVRAKVGDLVSLSAGGRYQYREVDYVHGRYLESGVNPYGIGGVGAGTAAGNCCIGAASGTWLYYQDPGYATIPYSTPQSNPSLYQIYNNFAVGNIGVKNPVTGGMTNPSTYLNTLWSQAGVTNGTETFFKDALNSYDVKERTYSGFLMADAGEPGDAYRANLGVRVVKTELTVDGGQTNPNGSTYVGTASWNGVNSNDVAFEKKRTYTDVLPSFNFVLNVSETQKLRVGAARVAAPQNLNDIGRGLQYGFTRASDGPNGEVRFKFNGGNAGNAALDPFRASQFNLAWENYFASSGLISVGAFYKAVDNFVTTAQVPTFVLDGVGGSTANVTSLVNGGTGKVKGIELTGQYAFSNGLGFQANYTRSDSETSQVTSFESNLPIPGVSKNSVNVIGYFERAGFSGRLAYAWRSKALNSSGVGSFFSFQDINGTPKTYAIYSAPYGQLDGQLGYDFGPHFGIVASVVNLTNEKQHTYLQWKNEPFTYDDNGRRFFFGVKGRL